jgi:excinuclease ABC subunit C
MVENTDDETIILIIDMIIEDITKKYMTKEFETILKNIPKSPGIYKYFNAKWTIIYIGKSLNLKNRVNSYFNGTSKLNFAKKKMVSEIKNLEFIVTNNETESLILEHTLVKKHQPKYNILLKDDKNYLYIKITDEAIPKIITTRQKFWKWEYFWPYISGWHVRNILKTAKKLFWYRSCNIDFALPLVKGGLGGISKEESGEREISIKNLNGTKIPCMDYYIKRCSWPCLLTRETISSYDNAIQKIKEFLSGNYTETIKILESEMKKKASELKFEEAKEIKESIESIQSLENTQIVRDFVDGDFDVVNYIEKYDKFFIGVIEIRESKITGYQNYIVEANLEESKKEILTQFIETTLAKNEENKEKITLLIPEEIQSEYIESFRKYIEVPKIGAKLEILKLCYKNIYEYAYKKHLASLSTKSYTKQTQKNLLETLGYEVKNKDIVFECNDISHLSGSHTVASRSIIENGKPNPSKYRKFTIKTLPDGKIDDFASMREIFTRRLKELIEKRNLPDLIIIDGWKWQLWAVMQIIEEFYSSPLLKGESEERAGGFQEEKQDIKSLLSSLQICSLAKQEEEIFLPYQSESILLKKDSEELRLIQKIRDEAHRFAITFNRDKRSTAMKKNILESIPWIGPKTRAAVLKEYGSIWNLKDVPKTELKKYLNQKQIEALEDHGII